MSTIFIPGLPRCGTTSLVNILIQHNEITIGQHKEPHSLLFDADNEFYNYDYNGNKKEIFSSGFVKYNKKINPQAEYLIDASTCYSAHKESCEKIRHELNKDSKSKLIILFRNSKERAMSHYLYSLSRGEEYRNFDLAVNDEKEGKDKNWLLGGYVSGGSLKNLNEICMKNISPAQLLIINLDDIKLFESRTICKIFNFIGLDPPKKINFDINKNEVKQINNKYLNEIRKLGIKLRLKYPALFDNKITRTLNEILISFGETPNKDSIIIKETIKNDFLEIDKYNLKIFKEYQK